MSFTTNALCHTIYIIYIKTPTYFGTQRPSSGSYCNKGTRANLLNTLQYTTPPVIAHIARYFRYAPSYTQYSYYVLFSTILKEWTTPYFRNTPSTINLEEEEIVDAPANHGNASMPEQIKRPNPWRKMMMMRMTSYFPIYFHILLAQYCQYNYRTSSDRSYAVKPNVCIHC